MARTLYVEGVIKLSNGGLIENQNQLEYSLTPAKKLHGGTAFTLAAGESTTLTLTEDTKLNYIKATNPVKLSINGTYLYSYRDVGSTFATDTLTLSDLTDTFIMYTGEPVTIAANGVGTLPAPLVAGTTYYAISTGPTTIQLASSEGNAIAGTPIDLTDDGVGTFRVSKVTSAYEDGINALGEFKQFFMTDTNTRTFTVLNAGNVTSTVEFYIYTEAT